MKMILVVFTAVIFCGSCQADCMEGAQAANSFMNAYKQFMDERKSKITPDKWIQGNKLITDNFKKSYKRFVDGAYKADPEMGLDSDPIFDAQDYPDKGFTIDSCDENNFVTLKGADWQTFKVVVKTLNTPVGWRVDGSGIINIPEDKRAKR